jgi:transposase
VYIRRPPAGLEDLLVLRVIGREKTSFFMPSPSGRPYPPELRERVMELLEEGVSPTAIARRLRISRMTVYRYQRAAQQQGQRVPQPRPSGGYRHSKLQRPQIQGLARLALAHPKDTAAELQSRAVTEGLMALPVSVSTVRRALHKAGVSYKRATYVDMRTQTDSGISHERQAFRHAQRSDPLFRAQHLLFFDESNFRLHEQASRGWAAQGPAILYRPKGQSLTTGVFVTLGQGGFFHYQLYPPVRPFAPLPARYQAAECVAPGAGVDVGLTAAQVRRATTAQLRSLLRTHCIKLSDEQGRVLSRQQLVDIVLHLRRQGRVGLLRATRGRQDQGGALQAFRATTRDVVRYWTEELVPWAEEKHEHKLGDKTVVWDNAPTHSAVRTTQHHRISVFHRWFREWGFRGVIFTPPRSPSFNPVELCFAYLKRWVRKWAPDEGYTHAGLEAAIHRAAALITPAMIDHWIKGCGYREEVEEQEQEQDQEDKKQDNAADPCDQAEPLPRKSHVICADVRGTVVKTKPAGQPRWRRLRKSQADGEQGSNLVPAAPPRRVVAAPARDPPRAFRWAGYGPDPPADVTETAPEVGFVRDDVYEPEALVDERVGTGGRPEYRVRWRGYRAADDTWEPREHLLVGAQQLLRDWERNRKRDQK